MKKLAAIILCMVVIFMQGTEAFAARDISVEINGEEIIFDTPPVIINGRTFIPIRAVCERLGADVYWYEDTRGIVIVKNGIKLFLQIWDYYMYRMNYESFEELYEEIKKEPVPAGVDEIKMDVFPVIENDRTLLPVRYVAEALGAEVGWDEKTSSVKIFAGEDITGSENRDKDFFEKYIQYYKSLR